jgi:cholesterol oxidase
MAQLSSPINQIGKYYPIVVVGSGYGGAIAASRLARAGQRVCLLERGREFQPGEFPDTEPEALAEMQAQLPSGHIGSRTGLYDFFVNADINVFAGCGLGGTSLINGNVAVKPDARVFQDPRWPRALRDGLGTEVEEGYRRAQEMLQVTPYPVHFPALPKMLALEQSAVELGRPCYRAPITVTFKEGVNAAGVTQHPCKLCGDCISGCNYAAKNTVAFNYLADASNFGAEIYTQAAVRYVERKDGRWLVHYHALETGVESFEAPLRTVTADIVVLAAGTLGSTEILLRSKVAGLPLSEQLGEHFSGNGDVLGYSYGCRQEIRGVGYGHRDPRDLEPVGPSVTGIIDMRGEAEVNEGVVIQEITIPGALSGLLPVGLAKTAAALGHHAEKDLEEAIAEESEVESLFLGPYEAASQNTQAYLVTTHEGGAGRMYLANDRLQIEWPQVGQQPIFQRVNDTLAEATRPLGGTYMVNPVWSKLFNRDLITFHPLGGCVMAEDASQGVVNHQGQVFRGASGAEVYEGLYVCDGAVIPRSLGAGPLLTIAALSERTCARLARERGWTIDYRASRPAGAAKAATLGVQFSAGMHGDITVGTASPAPLELDLTVIAADLNAMLRNPDYQARVAGWAVWGALPRKAQAAVEGDCRLLAQGAEPADARQIIYRLRLQAPERVYYVHASQQAGTVHVVLHEGDSDASPILGKAMLRLGPQDLSKQLATLRVSPAKSAQERLEATARFGRALAGDLYDVYGGVVTGPAPRKKRPLRVNPPMTMVLPLGEGARLRLTRYEGGSRGPVVLASGPGVSSRLFALDTVETSLVEFLFAHGYDIWLLDGPDTLATEEYQMAVDKVREVAGVPSVQVVYTGRSSFALAGVEGLRAAIATPAPLDKDRQLNIATQEALPEILGTATPDYSRLGSLLGRQAVQEVYPIILNELEATGLYARKTRV